MTIPGELVEENKHSKDMDARIKAVADEDVYAPMMQQVPDVMVGLMRDIRELHRRLKKLEGKAKNV